MAWPFDNRVESVLPIDYGVQELAKYANQNLGNNKNLSGQSRGYENMTGTQAWPGYNPNLFKGMGVGRFDPRNLIRPDNLTQDLGASTYTGPQEAPLNTLDPNWQHQLRMQDIDRGNIDRGFLSGITGPVMGGLKWLGEKFKRPEAKQKAYESIMDTGTYKGNPYTLYDTRSGLKVGSDILGYGEGYAKNFDSMFGSQSLEEMEQKKLDWAQKRYEKLGRRGLGTRIYNALIKNRPEVLGEASKTITDIAPVTTTSGATTPNVHGGGSEASFTQRSPGGISQATSRAARTDQRGNVMSGWGLAEGGRIGYKEKGFVDPEEVDDLNIFDFMRDQGVEYDQMAEAVDQKFLSDELGAIDVTDEEIALISELLGSGVTDISTISSQTGKDEGTIERVIRVLNAKAQGGSVGYFEGGLASLV
jgi:hypothetical protein